MSRVLVTGATGFVGKAVRAVLADRTVRLALRTPPTPGRQTSAEEVAVTGPIEAVTAWEPHLADCDAVVHLAAKVHDLSGGDPETYDTVNHRATLALAEAAATCGVKRFVFLSSIKVLGEATPPDRPFTDASPPMPVDPYGRSKHAAETGLAAIAERTGLPVVVLRPPLVYGPGVGANFRQLLRLADTPWPLPFGGLANRRSLIHVANLADAVVAALQADAPAPGSYLVADDAGVSTGDLVANLRTALGRPQRSVSIPGTVWSMGRRLPGLGSRLRRLSESLSVDAAGFRASTGWRPRVDLPAGAAQTVAAYWAERADG